LFPTENSLLLHSTVQSADAAHVLSLKVACIKNCAKHNVLAKGRSYCK